METTTIKIKTHDALGKPFVLCYVSSGFAYFTSQKLEEQDGEDWHKINYYTSPPFRYRKEYDGDRLGKEPWEIIKIGYEGEFEDPENILGKYTAEKINKGGIAWLIYDGKNNCKSIFAGTTVQDFIELVRKTGGKVYVELAGVKEDGEIETNTFSLSNDKKVELL